VVEENIYKRLGNSGMNSLAPESLLHMYGYNVSEQAGLSAARRRAILDMLIDNHICTKIEIVNHLSYQITLRESREQYEKAIQKWQSDIDYLTGHNADEYDVYGVKSIRKNNYTYY